MAYTHCIWPINLLVLIPNGQLFKPSRKGMKISVQPTAIIRRKTKFTSSLIVYKITLNIIRPYAQEKLPNKMLYFLGSNSLLSCYLINIIVISLYLFIFSNKNAKKN